MDEDPKTLQPWQIYTALFIGFWLLSAYFDHFVITSILCLAGGICSEVLSKYMGGQVPTAAGGTEEKVPSSVLPPTEWEAPTKPLPPEPPEDPEIFAGDPLLSVSMNEIARNPSPLLNEPFEAHRPGSAGQDLLLAHEPASTSELLGSKAKDFMPEEGPAVGDLLDARADDRDLPPPAQPPRVSPKQALNNLDDFDEKFASSFQRTVQQDSTEDPPALDPPAAPLNITLDALMDGWPRQGDLQPHSLAGEALAVDDVSHVAVFGDDEEEEDVDLEDEYANREVDLDESESEDEDLDLMMEEVRAPPPPPAKEVDCLIDVGTAVNKEENLIRKENPEIDIDLTDPAVNEAATRIQAAFKGFKVRRMKNQ